MPKWRNVHGRTLKTSDEDALSSMPSSSRSKATSGFWQPSSSETLQTSSVESASDSSYSTSQSEKSDAETEVLKFNSKMEAMKSHSKMEATKSHSKMKATKSHSKMEASKFNSKMEVSKSHSKMEATKMEASKRNPQSNSSQTEQPKLSSEKSTICRLKSSIKIRKKQTKQQMDTQTSTTKVAEVKGRSRTPLTQGHMDLYPAKIVPKESAVNEAHKLKPTKLNAPPTVGGDGPPTTRPAAPRSSSSHSSFTWLMRDNAKADTKPHLGDSKPHLSDSKPHVGTSNLRATSDLPGLKERSSGDRVAKIIQKSLASKAKKRSRSAGALGSISSSSCEDWAKDVLIPLQHIEPYIVRRLERQLKGVQSELQAAENDQSWAMVPYTDDPTVEQLIAHEVVDLVGGLVGVNILTCVLVVLLFDLIFWLFRDTIWGSSSEEGRYQAKIRKSGTILRLFFPLLRQLNVPIF